MFDTIIRNGTVIDGTGAARRVADVGIKDGKVAVIGTIDGEAATVIDATGKIVTPGFIDIHTHYDAQAHWDTTLSPSPLHGITTVIGGNCGFTIAPLAPEHGDYLMRMLARVEGMPLASLQHGVPWNWASFGQWLDQLDGTLAINTGFMVGHSAIRRLVMGERSIGHESTPEELAAMQALLRTSIEEGGFGFSSSWATTHNDPTGQPVPSRHCSNEELIELARVCADHEGTSLEFIPAVGRFSDDKIDLIARMSAAANRPLNWNLIAASTSPAQIEVRDNNLRASDYAAERGGRIIALTVPCPVTARLSFENGFVLDALNGWREPMALPADEKIAMLADPDRRRELNELAKGPSPLRGVSKWELLRVGEIFSEENQQYQGMTIGEIAENEGREAFDVLCDIVVNDQLMTGLYSPVRGDDDETWKIRADLWADERTMVGGTDAGAHLDLLTTFNATTSMLKSAVIDRDLVTWEQAVNYLTDAPAKMYGLQQRGQLTEGFHADVNVIDPTKLALTDIEARHDLPGDAWRLYGGATGYDHVFCNGGEIVRNDEFTATRSGRVLRSGTDSKGTGLS
ncbi:MAG: amidohydrolase family protein [Actinomycetota bacterium]|nr:amidohydrolase family protein [Actinomycetota bacterium]